MQKFKTRYIIYLLIMAGAISLAISQFMYWNVNTKTLFGSLVWVISIDVIIPMLWIGIIESQSRKEDKE